MKGKTMERITTRHDRALTMEELAAHPMVRVSSSGSWLDSAR